MPSRKSKRNKGKGKKSGNGKGRLQRTKDGDGEDESHNDDTQLQRAKEEPKNGVVIDQLLDRLSLDDKGDCTHGCSSAAAKRGIGSVRSFIKLYERELNDSYNRIEATLCKQRRTQSSEEANDRLSKNAQEGCHLAACAELIDSLQHRLEIFRSDSSKRELLLSALLSLGTEYLLKEEDRYTIMAASVVVAYLRVDGFGSEFNLNKTGDIAEDLICNRVRTTVQFFNKKLRCSCLKQKWQQVRGEQKIGHCQHCLETMKSTAVSLCSGCRMVSYCSSRCQRADWPAHRDKCLQFRKRHNLD